ncbi:DUF2057 domain-containing protein [Thaumasiovibrio subtropicus]|uniref:YccT family protein n=1 Tax=Thaumasiovibrio subtropicus TaxID=1891207 RepID=UPI000B34E858|nr:DUF2057 domain-containing protein [Thaumasiovibrio subtropicus]
MKKLLIAAAVMFTTSVSAATLKLDENIKFLVVNGQEKESSSLERFEFQEMPEGENQIVIRFDGEVKSGSRDEVFTSKPYIFNLDLNGQNATISVPKRIRTKSQAQAFFRNPEWVITYANGSSKTLSMSELRGEGFGAYNDPVALVAKYNQQNGIIIDDSKVLDLKDDVVKVNESGEAELTGDAVAQLKLWYTKASAEEKVEFKVWLAQQ